MPFTETYAVNFANGNRTPHVNVHNWPDIVYSPATSADQAQRIADAGGTILKVTRDMSVPVGTFALNSVYVVPPAGALPLDMRLFMRVAFDMPYAEGLPLGQVGPVGPLSGDFSTAPRLAAGRPSGAQAEQPDVLAIHQTFTIPEPWAVALNVTPANATPSTASVNLTCQFNRQRDGVRLNTPGSRQNDRQENLESPLNYGQYQGGYMAFPNNTDGVVDPPIFTLEHSFCGWNLATNGHTPGAGSLKIYRTWRTEVRDHRVYSSSALLSAPQPVTSIGALGVSLVTQTGVGRLTIRVTSFSIWLNPPAAV